MSRIRAVVAMMSLALVASCAASEPATSPTRTRSAAAQAKQPAEKASTSAETAEKPASQEAPNPKGPIDLGLGEDDGGEIRIERPENPHDAAADLDQPSSKTYERACKAVADCEGLEPMDCDGEMTCAEGQCMYACSDEESGDEEDEFAEEDELGEEEDELEDDAADEL